MKIDMDLIDKTQAEVIQLRSHLELIERMLSEDGARSGQGHDPSAAIANLDYYFKDWIIHPAQRAMAAQQKAEAEKNAAPDPMLQRLDKIIELLEKERGGG